MQPKEEPREIGKRAKWESNDATELCVSVWARACVHHNTVHVRLCDAQAISHSKRKKVGQQQSLVLIYSPGQSLMDFGLVHCPGKRA